jgi:oxidase EvaA
MQKKLEIPPGPVFSAFSEYKDEILNSLLCEKEARFSYEEIISWFTNLKSMTDLQIDKCNICDLSDWEINPFSISHRENKYFEILGISSRIGSREVTEWCQPIIRQRETGIIGFIIRKINNVYHLLVQAKIEPGNFDVLEMAPTVQCITGSYRNPEYSVKYLEYFLGKKKCTVIYDTLQSEEGGRFFHEQNRNIVVLVDDAFPLNVDKDFIWMTFQQAKEFIKFNNYFNIEARGLLTCISPV